MRSCALLLVFGHCCHWYVLPADSTAGVGPPVEDLPPLPVDVAPPLEDDEAETLPPFSAVDALLVAVDGTFSV